MCHCSDKFILIFSLVIAPQASSLTENGLDTTRIDSGTQLSIEYSMGRKRKIVDANAEESDEEDQNVVPPAHDIYRSRLQKKVR